MHPLPLATQLRAAVLSGVFLAIAVPACLGINFELRATTQYQLEEWSLTNGSHSGNPFDLEATVTFEHDDGTRRTTGMFFDGEDTWKFRFTGVETGNWSFTTSSSDPDLDGHTGSINVAPAPAGAEGFMIRLEGDKWGKMGTNRALVPNHVMINNSLQAWDTPAERAAILDEFFGEHGFNGVHPAVIGAQFFNAEDGDRFNGDDHNTDALNPDPRTFEILEAMVQDVHARGGVMHFWPWGDSYRAQNLSTYRTPETGGVNGVVDRRLQRYFAARLGPIPGWTMGYGYDLFEWVSGPELTAWHDFMQAEMGWFHFLGARGRKNTVGQELLPDSQLSEEMDYTAYEQHFRDFEFDDWVATMNDRAGKPSFSEDRFRVTGGLGKDLTNEETRRLMWTLTMAGGIAAIWGDLDPEPVVDGEGFYGSGAYDNKEELKTFGVFWNDHRRFLESMEVGDQGQNDARVLVSEDRGNWVLYQENASSITVSLSGFSDPLPVVAVDAKEAYEEIPLDPAVPGTQTFNLPSTSDWAIAIGDFQPATEVPGQLDSKLRLIQESDLGGDPDDQASMVRFLLYTNEWDVEGIIVDRDPDNFADTNRHHVRYGDEQTALEMMDEHFYEAWESIYPTLSQHADGYPTAAQLRAITVAGHDDVDDGVQLILDALAKDDPRPIYYSNWGSDSGTESNLKRALDHLKANNTDAYNDALNRIINVSLDGNAPGRNRLGEHYNQLPLNVETGWPEKYGAGYGTRWYHQFRHTVGADNSDVESNHGPLGELWTGPKEGDTWCFMYLMPVGLSDPLTPAMGGWAGRYGPRADQFQGDNHWWNDEEDTVAGTGFANRHRNNTAARYDDAQANDFAARMDWCVEDFADANHPPKPVMTANGFTVTQGIIRLGAGPGATVNLSASATDPDGDEVAFEWVFYPEASTGVGELDINNDTEANASFVVPEDASPNDEIHVYLAATDNGAPALTRYCRLVVLVGDSDPSGPSADAGEDQAARDDDGDGFESVTLDGSASSDDGAIVSYTWTWDDGTAREATGVAPTLTLPVGSHIITLTVIDDEENFDSDTVTVNVLPEPGTVAFFEDFSSGDLSNWVEPPGHEVGTLGLRFETVGYNRPCALNRDEQITHLTLWMTPRSPLFLGCDLREMDEWTLAHVTNPLALTVNQSFENPAPVLQEGPLCIWKSTAPDGRRAACAIFNRGESPLTHQLDASRQARDVWTGEALSAAELAALDVPPHGARFIVADQ